MYLKNRNSEYLTYELFYVKCNKKKNSFSSLEAEFLRT